MNMDEIEYQQTVAAEQQQAESRSTFAQLRLLNVNAKIEKKGDLSYLSWAWAVDQLLQRDPSATWDYRWLDGQPFCKIGDTAMVFCTVRAFGVERTAQLPIMDHRNKPITNPDAFQVNTAMQRCLAKAIALHGIGLYIYAGEDVPEGGITKKRMDELRYIADCILLEFAAEHFEDMFAEWEKVTDNEERLAIWSMLRPHSRVRSAIKEIGERTREKEAA
jgi:hypothetical protein